MCRPQFCFDAADLTPYPSFPFFRCKQILREQLSPFDIQLRSVERQLDFSEAGKAVTRFLANRNRRLFSMSTENALITLLREGVSVQESSVDSKRDLEDCLRSACNDFIENTSSSILGPIAGFVDQCKNAAGSTSTTGCTDLINAPFMNGVVVNSLVSTALQNLDGELDNVTKQMTLSGEHGNSGYTPQTCCTESNSIFGRSKAFHWGSSQRGEWMGCQCENRSIEICGGL